MTDMSASVEKGIRQVSVAANQFVLKVVYVVGVWLHRCASATLATLVPIAPFSVCVMATQIVKVLINLTPVSNVIITLKATGVSFVSLFLLATLLTVLLAFRVWNTAMATLHFVLILLMGFNPMTT